ncbi:hypothetical protein DFS34DRAFT_612977 [Phlyctochytrium arcticum]|nr:hypothetical protein DFS34DRAFT_612977 [Phlyctochytrium arcticum]
MIEESPLALATVVPLRPKEILHTMAFVSLDDMTYLSLAGFILNPEERAALASSLEAKKSQEKLDEMWIWGKVNGVQRDYLIAQAIGDNIFSRKFFYSIDLVNWPQLPDVSPADMDHIAQMQGRFTGDPALEYPIPSAETTEEGGQPQERTINEEKRLSGTIALINYETEIVPRGAYYRDSLRKIHKNTNFNGISKSGLDQLTNYLHFREGFDVNKRTLQERAQSFDPSIDIFETIAKDDPKGVWSTQVERTGSVAILRSLLWPGYVFFHTPSPLKWGAMYLGTGQRNLNIGFML